MTFQTQVNAFPPLGVPGTRASSNPMASVNAGQGALVSDVNGLIVANFAWISGTTNNGGGVASNISPVPPTVPDGFVLNQHEALITTWLGVATTVIPQGLGCTLAQYGDFWAVSNVGPAIRGQKVYANLFNGAVFVAAAGAFPVNNIGSNAAFTIAGIVAGLMTVSAVASGVLEVGQLVQGPGIPANTYIQSLGTGTGDTGTYHLTQTTLAIPASPTVAATSVTPAGVGSASVQVDTINGSVTITVGTVNYGTVQVGMLVQGTDVPAGAYVASLGTGTGGVGTYALSAAVTGTVTETITLSSWIETPWSALSDGNPGDVIKIGIKN